MTTTWCQIASAEREIYAAPVVYLQVSGSEGELGIQRGHAPLLTAIKPGPVVLRDPAGDEHVYYISGGFLEVQPDEVRILADTVYRADDIDSAAAERAAAEARAAMERQSGEMDYSAATAHLAEAIAQIRTLDAARKKVRK